MALHSFGGGGGEMRAVRATRVTSFAHTANDTWYGIPFTSTVIENAASILSHDTGTNPERITLTESGLYQVTLTYKGPDFARTQCRINLATTPIPNTTSMVGDGSGWNSPYCITVLVDVTGPTYVDAETFAPAGAGDDMMYATFEAIRLGS